MSFFFFFFAGHLNNLHDTCLWMLIKGGESENEAQELLKVLMFSLLCVCICMHFTCLYLSEENMRSTCI